MLCEGCGTPLLEFGRLIHSRTGQEVCGPRCAERCDKVNFVVGGDWRWRPAERPVEYYQ